jgi:two-component system phosphate regulon response regulator PhoB
MQPNQDIHILLVEDEQDLQELLRYTLVREKYQVQATSSGEEALKMARASPPNLIILDLMLPGMDGLEVCKALKSREHTARLPVIMLTAKGEESDILRGLELGADDYVTKPFSPRLLLARINALLRRTESEQAATSGQVIESAGLMIDPTRHEVFVAGNPVQLTVTEFNLLKLLVERPGRVFTRLQIIEGIHDQLAAVTDRSVDVQVVSLRRKLGAAGKRIETVRGVGYRFQEQEMAQS